MRFAVSLSLIIALYGSWDGSLITDCSSTTLRSMAGGALMAAVCLVAQGVCNNMAVEARGLAWSFRVAALVALGFGAMSWRKADGPADTRIDRSDSQHRGF